MSLNADYQKLESGNDVRLIEVDGSSFGLTDVLRFHNYNIPHTEAEIIAAGGDESKLPAKPIWWQEMNTPPGRISWKVWRNQPVGAMQRLP